MSPPFHPDDEEIIKATQGDDTTGIKDVLKKAAGAVKTGAKAAYNASKGAVVDEAKRAGGRLALRAVKEGASQAQKNPTIKKAADEMLAEQTKELRNKVLLVVVGLAVGYVFFRKRG